MFGTTCQVPISNLFSVLYMFSAISNLMSNQEFREWFISQMVEKDLKQADIMRMTGLTRSAISQLANGIISPSSETCGKLAKALKLPVEEVYRKAGILKPVAKQTAQTEELLYLFEQFPDDEKADLITYMRIKLAMLEKAGRAKT